MQFQYNEKLTNGNMLHLAKELSLRFCDSKNYLANANSMSWPGFYYHLEFDFVCVLKPPHDSKLDMCS